MVGVRPGAHDVELRALRRAHELRHHLVAGQLVGRLKVRCRDHGALHEVVRVEARDVEWPAVQLQAVAGDGDVLAERRGGVAGLKVLQGEHRDRKRGDRQQHAVRRHEPRVSYMVHAHERDERREVSCTCVREAMQARQALRTLDRRRLLERANETYCAPCVSSKLCVRLLRGAAPLSIVRSMLGKRCSPAAACTDAQATEWYRRCLVGLTATALV